MREIHKKISPEYFESILSGEKTFEWRVNDFMCEPGDILVLEEYEYTKGQGTTDGRYPTGRSIRKKLAMSHALLILIGLCAQMLKPILKNTVNKLFHFWTCQNPSRQRRGRLRSRKYGPVEWSTPVALK